MKRLAAFAIVLALCALSTITLAQTQSMKDAETLVQTNCQICHSIVMLQQQRLSHDAWLAEVKKMKGWGAPVPDDSIAAVADYLAANYGPALAAMKARRVPAAQALAAVAPEPESFKKGNPIRGARLYANDCAGCHNHDARGNLGPNLVQQPILFRWKDWNDAIVRGRRSMPSFAGALSEAEVADILSWLRTRRVFGN